jgi:hypothetical protein
MQVDGNSFPLFILGWNFLSSMSDLFKLL